MKMGILPKGKWAWWAALLGIVFIISIILKMRDAMPLPTFAIAALGLAGFAAGIVAIIMDRDRSFFTYLAVCVGSIIVLWIAAELIFPH